MCTFPGISGGFRGSGGHWREGNGFGPVLNGGPGGVFWPVGQKFWARGNENLYPPLLGMLGRLEPFQPSASPQ